MKTYFLLILILISTWLAIPFAPPPNELKKKTCLKKGGDFQKDQACSTVKHEKPVDPAGPFSIYKTRGTDLGDILSLLQASSSYGRIKIEYVTVQNITRLGCTPILPQRGPSWRWEWGTKTVGCDDSGLSQWGLKHNGDKEDELRRGHT